MHNPAPGLTIMTRAVVQGVQLVRPNPRKRTVTIRTVSVEVAVQVSVRSVRMLTVEVRQVGARHADDYERDPDYRTEHGSYRCLNGEKVPGRLLTTAHNWTLVLSR